MTLLPSTSADAPLAPPERGEPTRAVLTAGGVETAYVRVGAGAPVVLLRAGTDDGAPSPLALALADRFRVLAPVPPATLATNDGDAFAVWLRDVLDGLGVDGATIVAEGAMAPPALAFALADPLRVRRIALVIDDAGLTVPAPARVAAFDAATPWPGVLRFLGADAGDGATPAPGGLRAPAD